MFITKNNSFNKENSRGFIHLVPTIFILVVGITALILFSTQKNMLVDKQPESFVLSESDEEENHTEAEETESSNSEEQESHDEDGESNEEEHKENDEDSGHDDKDGSDSSGSNSSDDDEDESDDHDDELDDELEEDMFEEGSVQRIEIRREGDKFVLKIKEKTASGEELEQEIEIEGKKKVFSLEIQNNGEKSRIKIRTENGRMIIEEETLGGDSALATTLLPLLLDSENGIVTVPTHMGQINISQFPHEVENALISLETMDEVDSLVLKEKTENSKTKIVYQAKGEDDVKFLGMFKVSAGVVADVDAVTGEQMVIEEPWYLQYLDFLFTD